MTPRVPLARGLCLPVAILCCGCGAGYPPPEGYVDTCYGGDFKANLMQGQPRKFEMRVTAGEAKWPELRTRLGEVAKVHKLEVFDTSMTLQGLRMFEVSLCSRDGLWVYADKRIRDQRPRDPQPDVVTITLRQYKASYDWSPVAASLLKEFEGWAGAVESEYMDPLGAKPDTSAQHGH